MACGPVGSGFLFMFEGRWKSACVGVAGTERLAATVGVIDAAVHRADVGAVDVDADRDAVVVGVEDLVDVAQRWRYRHHRALLKPQRRTVGLQRAVVAPAIVLRHFGAAQQADQSPHRVVVYRRRLPRSPDETEHRKARGRIAVQQILPIVLRVRPRRLRRQPVVVRQQLAQQRRALLDDALLARLQQRLQRVDKAPQPWRRIKTKCLRHSVSFDQAACLRAAVLRFSGTCRPRWPRKVRCSYSRRNRPRRCSTGTTSATKASSWRGNDSNRINPSAAPLLNQRSSASATCTPVPTNSSRGLAWRSAVWRSVSPSSRAVRTMRSDALRLLSAPKRAMSGNGPSSGYCARSCSLKERASATKASSMRTSASASSYSRRASSSVRPTMARNAGSTPSFCAGRPSAAARCLMSA